ncbi:NERD domain-containing protein [Neoaquamicrobium sediminum]|uniref:NERD domain-containing protein n=1 Tax=Neoaquamicrobium sediminum TaxID=1849104 RepID=UPI003BADA6B3
MPAYRSAAEGEIREAVVARIRQQRPNARIIHEINVSTYGPNRIDLIAVDREEIIAVEIKSAKDKLTRLPAQIEAMRGCAHYAVVALHEKFLVEKTTNQWDAHYERDGVFYLKDLPDGVRRVNAWVYPEMRRATGPGTGYDSLASWRFPQVRLDAALPSGALDLLWRDELYALCGALRIAVPKRASMGPMIQQLRWLCTGRELTRGICAMLRARRCIEADPEIIEKVEA